MSNKGLKKGDFIWGFTLVIFVLILFIPSTNLIFTEFTTEYPYLGGFIKFGVLATMGELLAIRITTGDFNIPCGMIYRAIIWGILGMAITLIFSLFSSGVSSAMTKGMLPGEESKFIFALLVSTIMNCTFAPTMMAFHRITDTYIDLRYNTKSKVSLNEVVGTIDWSQFVSFVICKTIPLFWIPAHTITFLLNEEYRVIVAAFLSIALGCILAFAKKKKVSA